MFCSFNRDSLPRDGSLPMLGDLDMGLKAILMRSGSYGGAIRGAPTSNNRIEIRNANNTGAGNFNAYAGQLTFDLQMAEGGLVDGKDVSEIQKPSGNLYLSSDQLNLEKSVFTLVNFDSILPEFTDGIENTTTHIITPGQAGFYLVAVQVAMKNVLADYFYGARLRRNAGETELWRSYLQASISGTIHIAGTVICYLNIDDYVDVQAAQYTVEDTVDIGAGSNTTFLYLQRIR